MVTVKKNFLIEMNNKVSVEVLGQNAHIFMKIIEIMLKI